MPKIVVVEDDPFQAVWLEGLIKEAEPKAIVEIFSSESEFLLSLPTLEERPPALIITDLMIRWLDPDQVDSRTNSCASDAPPADPWMGGIRCVEAIRSRPTLHTTPIIICSVRTEHVDRDKLPRDISLIDKTSDPLGLHLTIRSLLALGGSLSNERPIFLGNKGLRSEGESSPGNQVFFCYSHNDRKWLDEIRRTLRLHMREDQLNLWDDQMINPGTDWRQEIESAIRNAKVAVLLTSRDFFASDFIAETEIPAIIGAAEVNATNLLWAPTRPSQVLSTPLARYQVLLDPASPLSALRGARREEALLRIAERIYAVFRAPVA